MSAFGCMPRASAWACARCVEANTSPSAMAWQTPTATASWPIATWRKPGQLAGAETLLDLLLEPADEEHLAVQAAELLLRQAAALLRFDLRHEGQSMLRLWVWRSSGTASCGRFPRAGTRPRCASSCPRRGSAIVQRRCSGRSRPAASRDHVRFVVSRDSGVGPDAARRLLANLDEEGIRGTLDPRRQRRPRGRARSRRTAPSELQWDALVAELPEDWSDLLCRVDVGLERRRPAARRFSRRR